MLTTITFVNTAEPSKSPVQGVVASLFHGDTFVSVAVSNVVGKVTWDLAEGDYDVVVSLPYRPGYKVDNPYRLSIQPSNNDFTIPVQLFSPPLPANITDWCRCSGYLYDVSGKPFTGTAKFYVECGPTLFIGSHGQSVGRLGREVSCEVHNGYGEVDLLQGATYRVDIPGFAPVRWITHIPELPAATLSDILFPVPLEVDFGVQDTSVEKGASVQFIPTVIYRSGVTLSGRELIDLSGGWPIEFITDPEGVVSFTRRNDGVVNVVGRQEGTCNISVVRSTGDGVFLIRPPQDISGTVQITVRGKGHT